MRNNFEEMEPCMTFADLFWRSVGTASRLKFFSCHACKSLAQSYPCGRPVMDMVSQFKWSGWFYFRFSGDTCWGGIINHQTTLWAKCRPTINSKYKPTMTYLLCFCLIVMSLWCNIFEFPLNAVIWNIASKCCIDWYTVLFLILNSLTMISI